MERCSSFTELLTQEIRQSSRAIRQSPSFELVRKAAQRAQRNLLYFEMPKDMRRPYILSSYRANHDLRSCLRSLLEWHNESLNVWSHLFGCAVFLWLLWEVGSEHDVALEKWPLYVFIVSALGCLGASAIYHLCGTANEKWYYPLGNVDYVGIVGLIVGSTVPVAWYSFGPTHQFERVVWLLTIGGTGGVIILNSITGYVNRFPDWLRILLFIALACSGVAALVHAAFVHDFSPRTTSLIWGVAKMGAIYLGGVGVYSSHLPEALAPRRFDNLGSSHQLWHACVLVAALSHFFTCQHLWRETALAFRTAVEEALEPVPGSLGGPHVALGVDYSEL